MAADDAPARMSGLRCPKDGRAGVSTPRVMEPAGIRLPGRPGLRPSLASEISVVQGALVALSGWTNQLQASPFVGCAACRVAVSCVLAVHFRNFVRRNKPLLIRPKRWLRHRLRRPFRTAGPARAVADPTSTAGAPPRRPRHHLPRGWRRFGLGPYTRRVVTITWDPDQREY